MHERRNFIMIILLLGAIAWTTCAWVFLKEGDALFLSQRVASTLMAVSLAAWLFYAMKFEDKLPDHLRNVVGEFYYEADGISFLPIIRVQPSGNQAELCVYYQNRFENTVDAILHLRPPEDSFVIQPGMRDVHFAFRADGGDFGVIHQPIAVPRHLQGEVIHVQMAAASWYPRSHGACLRRKPGMPCGTLLVDWAGNPLKIGVHEVSSEIPLQNPTTLRLAMPECVNQQPTRADIWRQEQLAPGEVALA